MEPATAILLTLVVYKIVLVGLGIAAQRRTRDGVDFVLGGRRLGPVVASISASASSSSAWTILGVSGAAYAWGLAAVWIFPACVGGFLLNWYLLAPALRQHAHRSGALTVTEVLAGPPGRPLRGAVVAVASMVVIVSLTAYVAAQFQAAGKTFEGTFGLPPTASILVGGGVVLAYTLLGGFWAVSLTDTLQGLVMAGAALVLPAAALVAVGGPAGFLEKLGDLDVEGYRSVIENAEKSGGLGFVLGLLGIGLGYPGQPHVVNRFMALRPGAAELKRGRAIAVGWAVAVYAGMLVLGWCGRLLYPGLADRERVFIEAANSLFPPVVAGVLIAAVLSAIMSTADSQLLVAASAVSHDLERRERTPGSLLRRSRAMVSVLSAAAIVAALCGSQEIFTRVLSAWTALGAAFGPLLLVTVLRGPVSPGRSLLAMLLGFALSVAFHSIPDTANGFLERLVPFAAAFAAILIPCDLPRKRLKAG